MNYVKIENNVVIQRQPYEQDGFVSVHKSIICGMVHNGGESFAKSSFSYPESTSNWDGVRADRDLLLSRCDWTALADAPLSASKKTAWKAYRQSLRDITDNFESPDDVVWPETP